MAALILLAGTFLVGCGDSGARGGSSNGAATVEDGAGNSLAERAFTTVPGEPLPAPSGTVRNSDGSRWTYRGAPAGKITLLYFGYTNCPDVCPTTMADIASALADLPASTRSKVEVQLVSTDPQRDTDTQLRTWLDGFDPTFHGGRAPISEVVTQAKAYGIGITAPRVTDTEYEVTHGSQVLVLRPGGDAVGFFRGLVDPAGYKAVLPTLIEDWT